MDTFPLSYTKCVAIKDLFGKQDILDNMFEYLFNFSIYHSRWTELARKDFETEQNCEKGARSNIKIYTKRTKMSDFDSIEMYNGKETVGMQYLRKIIEYCQDKEIQVLVTYVPYPAKDNQIAESKYVQVICDEYNVNYINFLNMDVVDYNTDLFDADHLNVQGARKLTDYIGKYIMANYDIQDQRMNENYSFWYEDYNEYIDYKIENLKSNKNNLNNYLMLLYREEDIGYEIKISSKREIREGSTLYNLLENLGNNYQIDDSVFKEKIIKITTWDKREMAA